MTEDQQLEIWLEAHPSGRKPPGTFTPEDGKCGAKVRNKDLSALGLERYCGKGAGFGTSHPGIDRCKFHAGSTPTAVRGAMRKTVGNELATLSQQLGEAPPLGPPEIEYAKLAAKAKQWSLLLEEKMDELNSDWTQYDVAGVERVRAVIELMERSWDRLEKFLSFGLKFGLDKRIVELEEKQASMVASAFIAIILSQDLKLTESQVEKARAMFAAEMTRIGPDLIPSWASDVHDDGIIDAEVVD